MEDSSITTPLLPIKDETIVDVEGPPIETAEVEISLLTEEVQFKI